jgi:imidazolonepropionase
VGANSVDVSCEEGRFTEDEARWILSAGRRSGLLPRLHACAESHSGAARLAAELGCVSADLLHMADEEDVGALARAGVAAVVCPGTALQTRATPPVRSLLDKGVVVALGSDHTPGGTGITSMALVISLAVSYFGMSVEEALRAATIGGAHALRATDRGAMARGKLADLVLWDADHEGAFVWSYGLAPRRVWRGGEPVA